MVTWEHIQLPHDPAVLECLLSEYDATPEQLARFEDFINNPHNGGYDMKEVMRAYIKRRNSELA
ncbi:MAG: hypothetical protein AB7F19_06315 [Candidatus Babeliales bacterium]